MKPLFTSLSPNTRSCDVREAVRLLTGGRCKSQRFDLEQTIASVISPEYKAILTTSGRGALFEILRAAGIGDGDEVILQGFTCLVVANAVTWTKALPVFADIDADSYNLTSETVKQVVTAKTKAVIVQHTFGIAADISDIRKIVGPEVLIIEDLAHSFGGSFKGRAIGSAGDIAFASFGRDKLFSSVYGGAVVGRAGKLMSRIAESEQKKQLAPWWWVVQQLLHPILMERVVKPLYFRGRIGAGLLRFFQSIGMLSKAVSRQERRGSKPAYVAWQMPVQLMCLLRLQLRARQSFLKRRREIAARYASELPVPISVRQHLQESAWLRVPVKTPRARILWKEAFSHHLFLGDWYVAPVTPSPIVPASSYTPGTCPVAESLSRSTLNLPTYPTLSDQQVDAVIAFLGPRL